jgi:hypothetical protein
MDLVVDPLRVDQEKTVLAKIRGNEGTPQYPREVQGYRWVKGNHVARYSRVLMHEGYHLVVSDAFSVVVGLRMCWRHGASMQV